MKSGNSPTVGTSATPQPQLKYMGWRSFKNYEECVKTLLGEGRDVKLCETVPEGIKDSKGNPTGDFAYSHSNAPRLNKLKTPISFTKHSSPDACSGYVKDVFKTYTRDKQGKKIGDQPYVGVGYSYNEENKDCFITSDIEDITEDNLWKPPPPPSPPSPPSPSPPPSKSSSHVGLILGITIPIIIIIIALVAYFLLFKK